MTHTKGRGTPYIGNTEDRRRNDLTAPWLALRMADAGYSEVREALGLPRLGEVLHTDAEQLWEAYLSLGSWGAVADEWRGGTR